MSHITADSVAPDFSHRQRLVADDLLQLSDPCVLFEHKGVDSDGVDHWIYTVGGYLRGQRLQDGCTVGGQVIVVHARDRAEADYIASHGLQTSIDALQHEAQSYIDAQAALARLATVGAKERIEAAIKPASDKSDAFVADQEAIRPLIGDDIVLATGAQPGSEVVR